MGSSPAELIIEGRVATLAGEAGFGWQAGLAIAQGRVVAVGAPADLDALAGPRTVRWRLDERTLIMPGITDAHLHLMSLAIAERQVVLTGAPGLDAALALLADAHRARLAAGDERGWLLGHGWSLHGLGRWPDAELLDRAAPGRPIALYAHDHHSRWLSTTAMQLAGIHRETADPDGGLIRRDEAGRPTGLLHETASALVDSAIPDPDSNELEESLARTAASLAALGITGCHDPGELSADRRVTRGPLLYRGLAARGRLPLRVHASVRAAQLEHAIELGLRSGQGVRPESDDPLAARRADRYRMGWLKQFADGSLGSRSAALLEPYSDAADNPPTGGPRGMYISQPDELRALLLRAAGAGIDGQVHAIGDGAVRMVLEVLGDVPAGVLGRRVEHAQLVHPQDAVRFGRLGIAASVQPVHLRSDAAPARQAWGERADGAFPLAAIAAGGALIPLGTDAPVEPADPWPGIAVAVCRRDPFAPTDEPLGPGHSIDLARAIRAACLDPAQVARQERLGRLVTGQSADLLIVPAQGFRQPLDPAVLAATRPLATLIDGELVHRAAGFEA
jgi:predicted amidohydrolase YtcJ